MASKFKRQQKQKKWSDEGSRLSPAFLDRVTAAAGEEGGSEELRAVARELAKFTALGTSYAEIEAMKRLAPRVAALPLPAGGMEGADDEFVVALDWLMDIMFADNSQPLHRQIMSALKNLPERRVAVVEASLEAHIRVAAEGAAARCSAGVEAYREGQLEGGLLIRQVSPAFAPYINRRCAVPLAAGITAEVRRIIADADGGRGIPPALMTDIQGGLGTLYTLINAHGADMAAAEGEGECLQDAALLLLDILQRNHLVREALIATAAAFWALALLPPVDPAALASLVARGLLVPVGEEADLVCASAGRSGGIIQAALTRAGRGTLEAEMRGFSSMGHVCAIKGGIATLPMEVLCAALPRRGTADAGASAERPLAEDDAPWVLLTDGALVHLTESVSKSLDAHHKFHVLSTLANALARVRAGIQAGNRRSQASQDDAEDGGEGGGGGEGVVVPLLSQPRAARVFAVLSACWEEPLNQSVKRVQDGFEELLNIQAAQAAFHFATQRPEMAAQAEDFVKSCAADLLQLAPHKKGRYAPLAILAARMGALSLLEMEPRLVDGLVAAMQEATVCAAAASLLEALLQDIYAGGEGDPAKVAWRTSCQRALVQGLLQGDDTWRSNLYVYALPVLFRAHSGACSEMLTFITTADFESDNKIAAVLGVLKAGRSMKLVDDLDTLVTESDAEGLPAIPVDLLRRAMCHQSDSVRVTCMELACTHPRTSALPGAVEIELIKEGLVNGMRCTSSSTRHKIVALLGKLLARVYDGASAVQNRASMRAKHSATGRLGKRQMRLLKTSYGDAGSTGEAAVVEAEAEACEAAEAFMHWLTRFALGSLYPGAPYERKYMAVDILLAVLSAWRQPAPVVPRTDGTTSQFVPFPRGFFAPATVQMLVGALVDSWDRMREGAMGALLQFPAPLPGLSDGASVERLIRWGAKLLESPRVRESDSGARMLRIVHHMYITRLRWRVAVHPTVLVQTAAADEASSDSVEASAHYLDSLCAQLEAVIAGAKADLFSQCEKSFAHGTLLALRYTLEDVDWKAAGKTPQSSARMRGVMKRLVAAMREVMEIALATLSDPKAMGVNVNDELEDEGDVEDAMEEEGGLFTGHAGQVLTVGCWLTVKEVGLVVGTVARNVPLPAGDATTGTDGCDLVDEGTVVDAGAMLLDCMLTCKHNGAVEKCQVGFQALAAVLLHSSHPRLSALPRQWLSSLLSRLCEPCQTRDDITRRSSGLPLACVSLFTAEPVTSPKGLLASAMEVLLEVADVCNPNNKWEIWNQVHAFNVLRTTFQSRDLSMHGSAYSSAGLISAIRAMSSPSWEVRNSAALAFTELITRTLGFKNNLSGDSAKRAVTGLEFFHRYPSLHPFLLAELQTATRELLAPPSSPNGDPLPTMPTNRVHPSLYPILVLLSRLRPSMVSTSAAGTEALTPAAFIDAVQPCAKARLLAVRHLAAQAFAPLVAPDDLPACMAQLAALLPVNESANNDVSGADPPVGGVSKLNELHGAVLQMFHLLKANAASSPSAVRASIMATLPALHASSWLSSEHCPADTLRSDLLQLYAFVADFLRSQQSQQSGDGQSEKEGDAAAEASAMLQEVISQACRQVVTVSVPAKDGSATQFPRPSAPILYKRAARLYFGPSMARAAVGPFAGSALNEADLRSALNSPSYEVRAGALKGLLDLQTATSKTTDAAITIADGAAAPLLADAPFLHSALLSLVDKEGEHFKVVERALRLLVLLPAAATDAPVYSRLLDRQRHPGVRNAATVCLGKALATALSIPAAAQLDAASLSGDSSCDALHLYVERLKVLAEPVQTCDGRLCAAAGLSASGLLLAVGRPQERMVSLSLSAWQVALALMEDEDGEVREAAAQTVRSAAERLAPSPGVAGSQVELVFRQVLALLASLAGASRGLADLLLRWVSPELALGAAKDVGIIEAAFGRDSVQRLFDKELDNQHEEPLLFSQGAALHLAAILSGGQDSAAACKSALAECAPRAAAELRRGAAFLLPASAVEGGSEGQWVGGPTNHPDVFRPLYQLTLLLRVAARSARSAHAEWESRVEEALREAATALLAIPLQPALGNLLTETLLLWEKRCSADLHSLRLIEAMGDCYDPDFNAFYLISG